MNSKTPTRQKLSSSPVAVFSTPAPPWRRLLEKNLNETVDIPNFAKMVVYEFGSARPPIDVDFIARRLEVEVKRAPSRSPWNGAVHGDADGAVIWTREGLPEDWRRFTLAHELGHLLLHPTETALVDAAFPKGGPEGQATRFAAAMLVPVTVLEEIVAFEERARDPAVLARTFRVPEEIMRLQVAELLGYPVDW